MRFRLTYTTSCEEHTSNFQTHEHEFKAKSSAHAMKRLRRIRKELKKSHEGQFVEFGELVHIIRTQIGQR